jgi:hypothetical protein
MEAADCAVGHACDSLDSDSRERTQGIPGDGVTHVWTFDGKPVAFTGPAIPSGETVTGKIDSDRVIEIAFARLGTPVSTMTWTLSADGKTLTESMMMLGPDASKEPSVSVFLKQ